MLTRIKSNNIISLLVFQTSYFKYSTNNNIISKGITHLLVTNWLKIPLDIQCIVSNVNQWINPHRPDLNINRILYPYCSVNSTQMIKPINTCYHIGNFGQFKLVVDSQKYGRALVYGHQVNAYGMWQYDLTYGMYTIRHRTGLNYNIYQIKGRDIPDNSRWMQKLTQQKPDIKINQITMPGSHDSGMIINRFSFLKRLTQNQYLDILGQLKAGVRYFDIRLTIKNGQYMVYHGNDYIAGIGITLQSLIVDINAFIDHYGWNQTIFVAVSKTRKQMKPQQRHELIIKLENQIRNVVFCRDIEQSTIANQKLRKYRGKVVLLYDCSDFVGYKQPVLKFKDLKHIQKQQQILIGKDTMTVYDSYSNTNMIQTMIDDQNKKLQKYGGYNKNYLFLYSFTLTVQSQLRLSPQRYSIQLLANISRARLPIQLQKMKLGQLKKPNIIYYDFVDAWSCSAIIDLNNCNNQI